MTSSPRLAALIAVLVQGAPPAPTPAAAAPAASARAAQIAPDSAALRDEARDAQAEFERLRRRWLPRNRDWPGGGSCDEVVGRICLRYGEGSDWYLGPEDTRITDQRAELLAVLGRVGEALPGDGWVLGQRVFYLVEADSAAAAADLSRRCGGVTRWWCRALEGYALHRGGRFEEAETAFREALAAMDPEGAREWRDPEVLLDARGRDALERVSDAVGRDAAERRLWDLVDPLYLVPGNDRWTSHMARHVVAAVRDDARSPWTLSWGPDMAELTVRYGWEVGWELQAGGSLYLQDRPGVVGHHHPESRVYVPTGEALADPAASRPGAWGTGRQESRTGHAPEYAPVTLPGEGQVAVFPRADRVVVVASHALPDDTTYHGKHDHATRDSVGAPWRGLPPETGLFLVPVGDPAGLAPDPAPGGPPGLLETRRRGSAGGVLVLEAPAGAYVASLEGWSPADRRAGRIRRGVRAPTTPPDVPTVSELLLLADTGRTGETLEEAAPRALPRSWLRHGDPLVLGWEVHGLGWRPETVAYRLTVEDDRGNLLQRAGRFLGLLGDPARQTLAWQEPAPTQPRPHFRSVSLSLPALDPGTYTVRLEVRTAGREPLVTERELEIRPTG